MTVARALQLGQSKQVTVNAWIRTVRKQRKLAFAELDDGSSLSPLQATLEPGQAQHLSTGTAVKVTGSLEPSPVGKEQAWELRATEVVTLGQNDATDSPIQKKYQTSEFLRTLPHLRTRIPHYALLLRLRSEAIAAATSFFREHEFFQVHTPVITSSDCEGAGEVFTVAPKEAAPTDDPFFREQKFLTVSSQLHLEAMAQSVGRVWTLSPTFRAEKSDTARHLNEFYMLEAELAFTDNLHDVMNVVEELIRSIARGVAESSVGKELLEGKSRHDESEPKVDLRARFDGLAQSGWPRITYQEAIGILQRALQDGEVNFEASPSGYEGIQTEHERYLAKVVGKGRPVFVTDYPQAQKPFYMAASRPQETSSAEPTVSCFDLLMPDICEVVGGSIREHSLNALQDAMQTKGLGNSPGLEWYLDLRRYGSVPHGGFGLGFDRLLCYMAGISNIRDVVAFPRWYGKCIG